MPPFGISGLNSSDKKWRHLYSDQYPMNKNTPITDYSTLLDAQTQAFIHRTNAAFPDNAVSLSIAEQRQFYDAMCREFHSGYPDELHTRDYAISHFCSENSENSENSESKYSRPLVPVREYTPALSTNRAQQIASPHIVYLHGGGFVVGGLESHDDICAEISDRTGLQVTSVDYCLAPEYKYLSALNEVMLVMCHLSQQNQQPLILCGDSAGANLAAATCHAFRNQQTAKFAAASINPDAVSILGQILVYPGLGGDISKGSYIQHAHSPMLTTEDVRFYSEVRCNEPGDQDNPLFAPLRDNDFSNIPPTVIVSAECDPLSDDGREYCRCIQEAGGKAHWINEKGLVHGYLRARHTVKRAAKSFDRIVTAIDSLADSNWPY